MKKIFIILFTVCALTSFADGDSIPELPTIESSADAPWDDSTVFWAGVTLGFVWGGTAWIFRMTRQAGKQNPEI